MKITVLDTNTVSNGDISLDEISEYGQTQFFDMLPEEKIIEVAKDSDIIICNKAKITENVMKCCPKLKFVTLFATGYNNIDLKAAKNRGITVSNVPGYSTDSVAQHTFSLILELSGNLSKYNASVQRGEWAAQEKFCYFSYPLRELCGKTLGIFGFGDIGHKVAEIGNAFSMRVIASTRTEKSVKNVEFVDKERLFSESDYLTLHCPLNGQTENLVNSETLSLMKPSAFLINTSRGAVVNEHDLSEALKKGQIAGAAIDVLEVEPMRKNHIYLSTPNMIITPHIAWATDESRKRLISLVCKNLKAFISGAPINTVTL